MLLIHVSFGAFLNHSLSEDNMEGLGIWIISLIVTLTASQIVPLLQQQVQLFKTLVRLERRDKVTTNKVVRMVHKRTIVRKKVL